MYTATSPSRTKSNVYKFLLPLLFVVSTLLHAEILTCNRCGYEYQPGQESCTHCNAQLPTAEDNMPQEDKAPEEKDLQQDERRRRPSKAQIKQSFIAKEMQQVDHLFADEKYWGAYLLARNTRSLNVFSNGPKRERHKKLTGVMRESLRALELRQGRCIVCKGGGAKMQVTVNLRGELNKVVRPGTICSMCNGKGRLEGLLTEDKNAAGYSNALRQYRDFQADKGLIRHHDIWLPEHIAPRELSAEDTAAYRTAYGVTCDECHGIGFFGCESCNGVGRRPCTNNECIHGAQLCSNCDGKRMVQAEDGRRRVKCRQCLGRGTHRCTICRGNSFLQCDKCHGGRRFECKKCDGQGEVEPCRRCDGLGASDCRKCRGTGEYKSAPCPSCDEEGVVLCKSCKGYGFKD